MKRFDGAATTRTVVIEQTYHYARRMKYIPETHRFVEKPCDSLAHVRGFRQPYGWLKESGTPPEPHLDVILMTEREFELGDEASVELIGVFRRNDGDHKLVAVLKERDVSDLAELTEAERADLHRLYPREDAGEGWFGKKAAEATLREFFLAKQLNAPQK